MSVIHWQFCPPVQSPVCIFSVRVTERSETMISVAWNFPVMWDRTTTQPGMQGLMAETPLQAACVHSSSSQACTSSHLQLRSVEGKHSSQGRVSVTVSLRNVPSDEVSLQGAGFLLLSTQGHLGKVAFLTAESDITGTWRWCLGHTTCLQPGPKMALEQSAAQKLKPSLIPTWHLFVKQRSINIQAIKFRNRQNIFSQ